MMFTIVIAHLHLRSFLLKFPEPQQTSHKSQSGVRVQKQERRKIKVMEASGSMGKTGEEKLMKLPKTNLESAFLFSYVRDARFYTVVFR